jgi:hypothetical protein
VAGAWGWPHSHLWAEFLDNFSQPFRPAWPVMGMPFRFHLPASSSRSPRMRLSPSQVATAILRPPTARPWRWLWQHSPHSLLSFKKHHHMTPQCCLADGMTWRYE